MKRTDQILRDIASSDPLIRNRAALKAIDHGVDAAAPVLFEAIMNPENAGFNGTLVYALGHFDCSSYFPALVRISITYDYEPAWGAMCIIDDQKLKPSEEQLEDARIIMEEASLGELTDDQSEALDLIRERYYKS